MTLYTNYGRRFIPFHLKKRVEAEMHCFLGGTPPVAVRPPRTESATRYFATLNLDERIDVSIFTTFEYERLDSPFNFFKGTYKLHNEANPLVQFVLHQHKTDRDTVSPLSSHLPQLGFVFGTPGIDPDCTDTRDLGNPSLYADHKVGGYPVFSQLEHEVDATLDLLARGYVHLLQMSIPSAVTDTVIHGMWPFGESVFHVFARETQRGFEFYYIWG